MQDAAHMESTEAPHDLDKDVPDLLLLYVGLALLIVADFLKDVAVVRVLHDQTQTRSRFVNEGIFIPYDIWVVDGGKDSDLV